MYHLLSGSQSRAHPPACERDRARHPALDEPTESEGQCLETAQTTSLLHVYEWPVLPVKIGNLGL